MKNRKNVTVTVANEVAVETAPVAEVKRGRGRPPVYSTETRATLATLIQSYGALATQALLASRNGVVGVSKVERERAKLRVEAGFAKPTKISLPTLLRFAKDAGVTLRRGRRTVKVEVVPPTVTE